MRLFLSLLFISIQGLNCFDLNIMNFKFDKLLKGNKVNIEILKEIYNFKDLNENYDQSSLKDLTRVKSECEKSLDQLTLAAILQQDWFFKVADSFGKPPSGLLEGNTRFWGNYDECIEIINEKFEGKFCSTTAPGLFGQYYSIGLCVPKSCTEEEIMPLIAKNMVLNPTLTLPINTLLAPNATNNLASWPVTCQETLSFDAKAIVALVIIGILLFFVFLGTSVTFIKGVMKYINETKAIFMPKNTVEVEIPRAKSNLIMKNILQFLLSFCLYTNTKKLFKIPVKKANSDQLGCLNGIRFLTMTWVLLGHTFFFSIIGQSFSSVGRAEKIVQRFSFLAVTNAYFSVDTFFLMSGLLTSYLFLKEVTKKGVSLGFMIKYYIHRFWRILPPYMLCVMLGHCLLPYFGKGPYASKEFDPDCATSWWTNLLFINNLARTDKQCFGVAWYLANDMQFYWIAPLMLIPLAFGLSSAINFKVIKNNEKLNKGLWLLIGIGITLTLLLMNLIALAILTSTGENMQYGQNSQFMGTSDFFDKVYITPWGRIGPYLIGILYGLAIHVCSINKYIENISKNKKHNFFVNCLNIMLLMLSIALIGLEVFVIYDTVWIRKPWPKANHVLYETTSRSVWSIALGYIIFSCVNGKGGFINDILSWPIWTPLARLSFSAYLIHTFVLTVFITSQRSPYYLFDYNMIYLFIGHLFTTYLAAYAVSMVFEVPLLGLEKFIFPKPKPKVPVSELPEQNKVDNLEFKQINTKSSKAMPPIELSSNTVHRQVTNERF